MGLFEPVRLAGLDLKNRLVMAPMTMNQSPGNVLSEANIERYVARARGGIGLIITEGMLVPHPTAADKWGQKENCIPVLRPAQVKPLSELVRRCHADGSRLMVQVWHQGPKFAGGIAPAGLEAKGVLAATGGQLEELLEAYWSAAAVLVEAGVDGAELHAAHGYFLHACLKHGDAGMAGGWTGRGYVQEVTRIFADAFRGKATLQLRFSQWEVDDYEAKYLGGPGDLERLLAPLRSAGVQVFHVSTRRWWLPAFEGSPETLAAMTRRLSGLPVVAVGSFGHRVNALRADGPEGLSAAEAAVAAGAFDLMAVGRPLLSDADFSRKLQAGQWDQIVENT